MAEKLISVGGTNYPLRSESYVGSEVEDGDGNLSISSGVEVEVDRLSLEGDGVVLPPKEESILGHIINNKDDETCEESVERLLGGFAPLPTFPMGNVGDNNNNNNHNDIM